LIIDLLRVFFDNIAPILIIAGLGFVVGKRLAIDSRQLGRLLFNLLSPALVLHSLTVSTISVLEFGQLALAMALLVGCIALLAFLISRLQTENRVERAGFILTTMWPNTGNLGLPVISFAFGPEVFARAVIFYVTVSILSYTLGLYVASSGKSTPRQALMSVLKVPMVYAVILGLLINITQFSLPLPLERSVALLSQATIPVMLILLGLQLAQSERLRHPQLVISAVGVRLLISPVLALILGLALSLNGLALIAFVMQAAMPVAVATIIFASEFYLDREQILGGVLVSTLASPITLSLLILILQQVSHLRGG
jgi:malate permease and related proteins